MWDFGKLRRRTRYGLSGLIDGLDGIANGLIGFFIFLIH
jgi:hypothetical protein